MSLLVRESDDLVLDGWTVSRAYPDYGSSIQRTSGQIPSYHFMCLLIGVGDPAASGVLKRFRPVKAERNYVFVAVLSLKNRVINAPAVDSGRRTGLESSDGKPQIHEILREPVRRAYSVRAAVPYSISDEDLSAQIRSGADHRCLAWKVSSERSLYPAYSSVLGPYLDHFVLEDIKIRLRFQRSLHISVICPSVALHSQGMHRRAFGKIQHPALQHGGVSRLPHLSSEGIQFHHQMSLAGPSYRRVAGHVAYRVQSDREHCCSAAQPGRGKRRFYSGMSRPDHGYIITLIFKHPSFLFPMLSFTYAEIPEDSVDDLFRGIFSAEFVEH